LPTQITGTPADFPGCRSRAAAAQP